MNLNRLVIYITHGNLFRCLNHVFFVRNVFLGGYNNLVGFHFCLFVLFGLFFGRLFGYNSLIGEVFPNSMLDMYIESWKKGNFLRVNGLGVTGDWLFFGSSFAFTCVLSTGCLFDDVGLIYKITCTLKSESYLWLDDYLVHFYESDSLAITEDLSAISMRFLLLLGVVFLESCSFWFS